MAPNVRICLVGTLRIDVAGVGPGDGSASPGPSGPLSVKLGPLGRLALAYLVVERARPVPRDELADVLWGEDLPPTWVDALRGVVARVRALFEASGVPGTAVTSAAGCYQLVLPPGTVVDVEAAPVALEEARAALAAGDAPRALHLAREVASAISGQFAPGLGGAWVERRQAALAELRLQSLELLSEAAVASGNWRVALESAEEAVRGGPLRESAHIRLIAAHVAAGNRAEALRAYERCRRTLAEELGVSPSPATEAAYLDLLTDESPPDPAATGTPEAKLPTSITSFVGRGEEMAQVKKRLGDNRLLTLVGIGGVGKSRLGLELAGALPSEYPDGVYLVELAGLGDPTLVAQQVLSALGAPEVPGQGPTDSLIRHLAPRRLLLMLDNCEHLVGACAALADNLLRACYGLQILATSREPLGVAGEAAYVVPPLSTPDAEDESVQVLLQGEAVRLFADRAAAASPTFELTVGVAPAVARICRRLDGIPLAIELAAARARLLSVDDIAGRLDDRFRLLVGGPRTAPARHQTLRAALDWSYEALSAAESILFRRLSVFAGGLILEAAETVCAEEGVDVLEALSGLVDKSLVMVDRTSGATRYRLLETVRQYAAERLVEHGEEPLLRGRHLAWFDGFSGQAEVGLDGAKQVQWLRVLDAELDNLRAALDWAAASADASAAEAGARLAAALGRFWEIRGYLSEGRLRLDSWAVRDGVPAAVRAKILAAAGILAQHQRDVAAARSYYEESLVIRRSLGDRRAAAASLHGLANMAYMEGELEAARSLFEENLALARELGDRRMAAASLMNLGVIEQMLFMRRVTALEEGAARARAYYSESLAEYRALEDRQGMALALENLGAMAPFVDDWEGSRIYHEESMTIRRELGDKLGIAASARFLGRLALRSGESRAARSLHEEYLSIERELGNKQHQAEALTFLADVARAEGQLDEARALLDESVAIQREVGDRGDLCWMLATLGEVAAGQRDVAAAGAALEESEQIALDLGRDWDRTRALSLRAKVARAQQELDLAAQLCGRALENPAASSGPRILAALAEVLTGVAVSRGELRTAAQLCGAIDALRREMQAVDDRPDPTSELASDETAARQGLGDAEFRAAWFEGARMTREELADLLATVSGQ